MTDLAYYTDPESESILRMGPSGGALILVTDVAHVSSRLRNEFDKQRKPGRNFGRVKFLGILPATFTVTFIVLPQEESVFWKDVVPLFRQKGKKGNAPPMDIVNPQINRVPIQTVMVVSAEIGPPSARDGRAVFLQLEEWTPAPVKPNSSDKGKSTSGPPGLAPQGGLTSVPR